MFDATNLSFSYHTLPVLQEVSLSLQAGEVLALVGPNGSGKTTLLKCLSGVLQPTAGSICIDRRPLTQWSRQELAQTLAAVEQHIHLPFDFSVRSLIGMGRHPYQGRFQRDTPEDRAVVQRAMERTGTSNFAERPLNSLSSGERQRVWLAMALAQEPRVLLLDEPTSHLDIQHQLHFLSTLRQLTKEGLSVIMSIHDLTLAGLFADRVALLHEGTLHSLGAPEEVMTVGSLKEVFHTEVEVLLDSQGRFRGIVPLATSAGSVIHGARPSQ